MSSWQKLRRKTVPFYFFENHELKKTVSEFFLHSRDFFTSIKKSHLWWTWRNETRTEKFSMFVTVSIVFSRTRVFVSLSSSYEKPSFSRVAIFSKLGRFSLTYTNRRLLHCAQFNKPATKLSDLFIANFWWARISDFAATDASHA